MTAVSEPARMTFLFVYGTLKQGCCRHRALAGTHFCGRALTQPHYRLFHLGEYPGLTARPPGRVIEGELYRVGPADLVRLDAVEGAADSLFVRRPIALQAPHAEWAVEAYFYEGAVHARPEIIRCWTGG